MFWNFGLKCVYLTSSVRFSWSTTPINLIDECLPINFWKFLEAVVVAVCHHFVGLWKKVYVVFSSSIC